MFALFVHKDQLCLKKVMDGVEFNAPPDTVKVISEAVFTANHLTVTDVSSYTQQGCQWVSGLNRSASWPVIKLITMNNRHNFIVILLL